MLRVVVAAPPEVTAPEHLAGLPAAADLIELRLDLLPVGTSVDELATWVAAAPRPVIATVRSEREGGRFSGGAGAAAAWLRAAAEAGAAWLDAEHDVLALLHTLPAGELPVGVHVVASEHAATFDPAAPRAGRYEVLKHAGGLDAAQDLKRFRLAIRAAPRRAPPVRGRAFMPTGSLAALRVLDRHAALLYGSAGTPVVGGQPPLVALLDELRAGEVSPDARLFGLVGTPPAWSPSPALHNAVFRALGLDAVYVPLPGLSLARALELPFEGLSVTTPSKEEAFALFPSRLEASGAWNTLWREARFPDGPSAWRGANTDLEALGRLLPSRQQTGPDRRGVVFGAGGFARAALVALRRCGHHAGLVARDAGRGRALAEELGAAYLGARYERAVNDVALVNATPAGARGEAIPALDVDLSGLVVLDAPYAPEGASTWLVEQGRSRGAKRVVTGLDLLLAQAEGQAWRFARDTALGPWTVPDAERMARIRLVLELALRPRSSLVLVGLRGAGKTTVGRALAQHLGRPFVDLDAEVERITGRSPAAWIEGQGVEAFRLQEARALAGLEGRRGIVVATGGGVLERPENAARLQALGVVAWLDATAEEAARRVAADPTPRPPLLPGVDPLEEARRLKARRDPQYMEVAHEGYPAASPEALVQRLSIDWARFERDLRRNVE